MKVEIGADLANTQIGFPPAPAGPYELTITEVESKKKEGAAYSYLNWILKGTCSGPEGTREFTVWHMTSLSPNSKGFMKEFLEGCQAPYVMVKNAKGEIVTNFNTEDVLGRRINTILSVVPKNDGSGDVNKITKIIQPKKS